MPKTHNLINPPPPNDKAESTYLNIQKKYNRNLYKTLKVANSTKCHKFLHYIITSVHYVICAS